MASQQQNYTTGMTVTATMLNAEFHEIYTNITNSNIAAAAAIAATKLDLTGMTGTVSFGNTYGPYFRNASGADDGHIYEDASNNLNIDVSGDIYLDPVGNNVFPGSDSADYLGSASIRWLGGYFDAIDIAGTTTCFNITPATDSTYNLGTNLVRWTNGYFDAIDIAGNITCAGTVDGIDISAYLDQAVKTTSSPTFANITASTALTCDYITAGDTNWYLKFSGSNRVAATNTTFYHLGTTLYLADSTNTYSMGLGIVGTDLVFNSGTGAYVRFARAIMPNADNTTTNGTASLRWSDLRSVLINGADIGFQNNWKFREYPCSKEDVQNKSVKWMQKNANQGIQLLDEKENIIAVFTKYGVYADIKPLKELINKKYGKKIRTGKKGQGRSY